MANQLHQSPLRRRAQVASLVGATLFSGCAAPSFRNLAREATSAKHEPVVFKRSKESFDTLVSSGVVRPLSAGVSVDPMEIFETLADSKQFRLEHLHSLQLGQAQVTLDTPSSGLATLQLEINKNWRESFVGTYRFDAVPLSGNRWRRSIEISASAFAKGSAYLTISETDDTNASNHRPAFRFEGKFSPYFPASLLVSGLSTGGSVPALFKSHNQIQTDILWAYSVLGGGEISRENFRELFKTVEQLGNDATVEIRPWMSEKPGSSRELVPLMSSQLGAVSSLVTLQFSWNDVLEGRAVGRNDPLYVRVLGVSEDRVFIAQPSWDQYAVHPAARKEEGPGVASLPIDVAWSKGYLSTTMKPSAHALLGESRRPWRVNESCVKSVQPPLPDALAVADKILLSFEKDCGLPPGFFEFNLLPSCPAPFVFSAGGWGGLSSIDFDTDTADKICRDPRLLLAAACKAYLMSLSGDNLTNWTPPESFSPSVVRLLHRISSQFPHALRASSSLPEQLLFIAFDPESQKALAHLSLEEKSVLIHSVRRLGARLNEAHGLGNTFGVLHRLQTIDSLLQTSLGGELMSMSEVIQRATLSKGKEPEVLAGDQPLPIIPSSALEKGLADAYVKLRDVWEKDMASLILTSNLVLAIQERFEDIELPKHYQREDSIGKKVLAALFAEIDSARGRGTSTRPPSQSNSVSRRWAKDHVVFPAILQQDSYQELSPLQKAELVILLGEHFDSGRIGNDKIRFMLSIIPDEAPVTLSLDTDQEYLSQVRRGMILSDHFVDRTDYMEYVYHNITRELSWARKNEMLFATRAKSYQEQNPSGSESSDESKE